MNSYNWKEKYPLKRFSSIDSNDDSVDKQNRTLIFTD